MVATLPRPATHHHDDFWSNFSDCECGQLSATPLIRWAGRGVYGLWVAHLGLKRVGVQGTSSLARMQEHMVYGVSTVDEINPTRPIYNNSQSLGSFQAM